MKTTTLPAETTSTQNNNCAARLLKTELGRVQARLRTGAEIPKVSVPGGDFLDVAQDLERQELARISASRLTERARRLRDALLRVSAGEYGVCAECGAAIPTARLLAVPDATTCVACQAGVERDQPRGAPARAALMMDAESSAR
jgi:DnaK suppressor protein